MHYARAAIERWREEHKNEDPEPGTSLTVRLLPANGDGDSFESQVADAAAEIEAMKRRHGLI